MFKVTLAAATSTFVMASEVEAEGKDHGHDLAFRKINKRMYRNMRYADGVVTTSNNLEHQLAVVKGQTQAMRSAAQDLKAKVALFRDAKNAHVAQLNKLLDVSNRL